MKILVTGCKSFIGLNFCEYVLRYEHEIVGIDKETYAANLKGWDNLEVQAKAMNRKVTFYKGDICDTELVKKILKKHKIDTIFHFAAESHVDNSLKDPLIFLKTNVEGTGSLLHAAREVWGRDLSDKVFFHISTDEVYGDLQKGEPRFTEFHPYKPHSPYSASKAASDMLVKAFHHSYGIPYIITHCSNNFGPYQNDEKFIPTVIRNIVNHTSIPVYGTGENIRDWIYVKAHNKVVYLLANQKLINTEFNIGGNKEMSNLELIQKIHSALKNSFAPYFSDLEEDWKSYVQFVGDRAGHDFRYGIDPSKVERTLGIRLFFADEALIETIKYYLNLYLL